MMLLWHDPCAFYLHLCAHHVLQEAEFNTVMLLIYHA